MAEQIEKHKRILSGIQPTGNCIVDSAHVALRLRDNELAVFTGSFSLGIFLAQYLLPESWLLPAAFACLALGCGALALPWEWRRRGVVIGAALALALGYDWLYIRQVQRPMEALADTETTVTMTLLDYADPTAYGAQMLMASGLAGISSLEIIRHFYYPLALGITAAFAILFRYPRKYS